MFGESIGPVDNVLSDPPLCVKRKCTEQSVPAQTTGYSSSVRLAVRCEGNLVGRHARPPSKHLLGWWNKANAKSSANTGVEGGFALLFGGDGVIRGAGSVAQGGHQQRGYNSHVVCDTKAIDVKWDADIPDRVRLEQGTVSIE
jgi:hypothetical protein